MEGYGGGGESELVSKTLQVEQKLFYFDLKENPRGRYLKISEKSSGSRSTIIVPILGVPWFIEIFSSYVDSHDHDDSKELKLDPKSFYFDVGVNKRGRFLKISEASASYSRSTIIVPAGDANKESWAAFRDILAEINEAAGQTSGTSEHLVGHSDDHTIGFVSDSGGSAAFAPDSEHEKSMNEDTGEENVSRVIRADQKRFFLDLGSNNRGQYLRISEVIGADRSTIIVPVSALDQFHEALGQFVDITKRQTSTNVRRMGSPHR